MEEQKIVQPFKLEVLFEDNHLIAVNKPSGIPVQRDITEDEALVDIVKEYVKEKHNKPGDVFLGITHRIDRPVSGVVLFAKTSKALTRINELFRERTIKKKYWALTKNRPETETGRLVHYISKNAETFKAKIHIKEKPGTQKAILEYELISNIGDKNLLEIELFTGRHHQIRAQLSKINCPIIGDVKYGYDRGNRDRSICLHSRSLEFIHPIQKVGITITAKLPQNQFWNDFRTTKKRN